VVNQICVISAKFNWQVILKNKITKILNLWYLRNLRASKICTYTVHHQTCSDYIYSTTNNYTIPVVNIINNYVNIVTYKLHTYSNWANLILLACNKHKEVVFYKYTLLLFVRLHNSFQYSWLANLMEIQH